MNDLTEELKTAIDTYSEEKLEIMLSDACENGDLNIVRYLLTSKNYTQYEVSKGFQWACQNGQLEVVRYLLTSPELKENADIHADNDEGVISACKKGHLDVVRYLLTSQELQEHARLSVLENVFFDDFLKPSEVIVYLLNFPNFKNPHITDEVILQLAGILGVESIIPYIIKSGTLSKKIDTVFKQACAYGHLGIVQSLIATKKLISMVF